LARPIWLELVILSVAIAGLMVAIFVTVAQLAAFAVTPECVGQWFLNPEPSAACGSRVPDWASVTDQVGRSLLVGASVGTVAAGLALGGSAVARELEAGTAEFAWALADSRRRWLGQRVVLGLLIVFAMSAPLAWSTVLLEEERTARGIWVAAYPDADLVGLPVAARALFAYGLGLALGTVLGRTLPTFLAGAMLVFLTVNVLGVAQGVFASPPANLGGASDVGAYLRSEILEVIFVDTHGHLLSETAVLEAAPDNVDVVAWVTQHYVAIPIGIAAGKYHEWQLILTAYYGLAGLGAIAAAFVVVLRRRPY
jgi:hypothetical protein